MVDTTEHKVFVEVQNGGLVNKFRRKAAGSHTSVRTWLRCWRWDTRAFQANRPVSYFTVLYVWLSRLSQASAAAYRNVRDRGAARGDTFARLPGYALLQDIVVGANNLDLKLMVSGPDEGPDDESVNGDHLNESTAVHHTSMR